MELVNFTKQMDKGMSSLFGRYSKERAGREIIECDDYFVTYSFYPTHLFIEDMYIVPEKRGTGLCNEIISGLEGHAKANGINKTVVTISPEAKNIDQVLLVVTKLNFKIFRSSEGLIYLSREIK